MKENENKVKEQEKNKKNPPLENPNSEIDDCVISDEDAEKLEGGIASKEEEEKPTTGILGTAICCNA